MTRDAPPKNFFLPDFCTTRSVLVVVVVAELLAVVLTLMGGLYESVGIERFALNSLFVQWVALTSAGLLCAIGSVLDRLPRAWAATLVVALVVVDTFVFSLAARAMIAWAVASTEPGYPLWSMNIFVHVAIAAIITGLVMRYFYVQEQLKITDEAELQSRIQALQSRIRPHFLFNSMNIIASLIAVDPETAEQVVEDLSRLFRASLKEAGHRVSLEDELELCRRYVRIEGLRLGDRLHVEWDLDGLDTDKVEIPLLTLQPLLENAIYHGIQPLSKGGRVKVSAVVRDGMLELGVSNPLPEQASQHRGNRMALENIRHRLEALYGQRASVVSSAEDGHYEVVISYPLEKEQGSRKNGTAR